MTKAILFDIDGTLIDSFEASLKFFTELMARCGYPAPVRESFAPMFSSPMPDTLRFLSGGCDDGEIDRIIALVRSGAVPVDHSIVRLQDSAEATLRTLAESYRLGIVTSRLRERVYLFHDLELLKDLFEVVVSFDDVPRHKPDPAPLLFAAKRLGLDPTECLYVGDAQVDVDAARAAGMKSIAFRPMTTIANANAVAKEFASLPNIIASFDS